MRIIACCLTLICLLVVGFLGSPLFAQDERGLTVEKEVSVTDQQGEEVLLYQESHALVIGISHYTDWPNLPGVRSDVQEVQTILEAHGFHVVVKTDPDGDALEEMLKEFITQYGQQPHNRLLVYFAGHGHTHTLAWGGEMGYIVPADAPLPEEDDTGFIATAMPMQTIEGYARLIQSKHALFVFDSCFSGSIFALSRAVPEHISHRTARPVRQFITSGSAEETVPDESVFRQQFIAALEGEGDTNGDGYVTAAELGVFLENSVINYTNGAQHPQYGKIRDAYLDKGDFVFQLPGSIYIEQIITTSPSPAPPIDPEVEMWELVKHSDNPSDLRRFLRAFPQGRLREVAQLKLDQLERLSPTPTPTATPVPMPTISEVEQQLAQLLEQGEAYFERQWYTTPEDSNAFDVYREVLKLDPDHELALQRIQQMLDFYQFQAARAEEQGKRQKALRYYRRYLKIAPNDDGIWDKIAELEKATPTPLPTATPTPRPTVTPRPTATPTIRPTVTPTPLPKIHLRSEPQTVSQDEFKKVFGLDENRRPRKYIVNDFEERGDVVVDHATGLMWQKSGSGNYMTYNDALKYIKQLNRERFAGYNDWRLPTIPELMSLLEPGKSSNGSYINAIFDERQRWCWSSDKRSSAAAWYVYFNLGNVYWNYLDYTRYVRAVRS